MQDYRAGRASLSRPRDHIHGARLVMVKGAGHYVQVERPDETTAAIRDFVGGLRADALPHPRLSL